MAEFPALPIFTDAFISDTLHLTAAQTGAYFMLLMVAWRTKDCALPNDDGRLAAFARMDRRTWAANKDAILPFWTLGDDGQFRQKRLTDERNFVADKRDQAVRAGKASALKRKKRHSTTVELPFQPKRNNPTPTPTKKKNPPLIPPDHDALPSWVPPSWKDYLVHRGKKFTPRAQRMAIEQLARWRDQGHDIDQIIRRSVMNGWKGLFEPKTEGNDHGKTPLRNLTKSERADLAVAKALDIIDQQEQERTNRSPDSTELGYVQPLRIGTGSDYE